MFGYDFLGKSMRDEVAGHMGRMDLIAEFEIS